MKLLSILLDCSAISTLVVAFPVHAQTSDHQNQSGTSGDTVSEIIVTAQKRAEPLSRVGTTAVAFTGNQLKSQQIESISDLSKMVPGLTYSTTSNNTPVYTLRGIGFNDHSLGVYPAVSVYVDEVPLTFPSMTTAANMDLERVEVLKGPQGILFGENSTGGAINYIAAKPTEELSAGGSVGYGRFNTFQGDGYISGPITSTLSARLSVKSTEEEEGWQISDSTGDRLGKESFVAGRLLLDWKPEWGTFELNINGWHNDSQPQAPQFVFLEPEEPAAVTAAELRQPFTGGNPQSTDWSPLFKPFSHLGLFQVSLRGDFNIVNDIKLTSISSFVDYQRNESINGDGTPLATAISKPEGGIKDYYQELRLANAGGGGFRWIIGMNGERAIVNDSNYAYYGGASAAVANHLFQNGFYSYQHMENYAFYGNGDYDLSDKLTVKAGVRYSDNRTAAAICSYDAGDGNLDALVTKIADFESGTIIAPLKPGDCTTLNTNGLPVKYTHVLDQSNVSWRAGVDYKPTADTLLYFNVTKGYKAGGFTAQNATTVASDAPAVQESVFDVEGGFKLSMLDRRMQLTGAAFYYDYDNKQVLGKAIDPVFGVYTALVNIPKSSVYGAEMALALVPMSGIVVSASLNYLDAKVDKYTGITSNGTTDSLAGEGLPFTSKFSYSLSGTYTKPISNSREVFFGATLSGRTAQITALGGNPFEVNNAYATLDLRAGYADRNGKWRFTLWGQNVTNAYYWNNSYQSFDVTARYAARPATYGATLSFSL
jgi:iron complex outermembrane recepter protein